MEERNLKKRAMLRFKKRAMLNLKFCVATSLIVFLPLGCVLKQTKKSTEKSNSSSILANGELFFALGMPRSHTGKVHFETLMKSEQEWTPENSMPICFYRAKFSTDLISQDKSSSPKKTREVLPLLKSENVEALRPTAVDPVQALALVNATVEDLKLNPDFLIDLFSDKIVSAERILGMDRTQRAEFVQKLQTLEVSPGVANFSQTSCAWTNVWKPNSSSSSNLSLAGSRVDPKTAAFVSLMVMLGFVNSTKTNLPMIVTEKGNSAFAHILGRAKKPKQMLELDLQGQAVGTGVPEP